MMRSTLLARPVVTTPTGDLFRHFWNDVDVYSPSLTSSWNDDGWTLTVDLPGIAEDAIDVSVAGRILTVKVDTDALEWERSVQLRSTLDPDQVTARYVNGRLTIQVGATAKPEARQIALETSEPQPAIEASKDD